MNLVQIPTTSHLQDWDTNELSFWFHYHMFLLSLAVFMEPADLVIFVVTDYFSSCEIFYGSM